MLIPRYFFLKHAAAKDPGRYAMHSMLIESRGCVTTNGCVLVQKSWPVGLNGEDADMSAIGHALPLTKAFLKWVREQDKRNHFEVTWADMNFTIVSSGYGLEKEIIVAEDSLPFPDWRGVIPEAAEITSKFCYAKDQLMAFLETLPDGAAVEFGVVGDKNEKGMLALTVDTSTPIAGIIMPWSEDMKARPEPLKYFDRGEPLVKIPDPVTGA